MEGVVTIVAILLIGLLVGYLIGYLTASRRLHKQTTGTLMFDRAEPKNAPYLCFSSYEELDEIRMKRYATLNVSWTDSNSRQ